MSLNRLMLRLAVINALTQQPGDDAPPTMAGEMIMDSRLEDIEFREDGLVELPIIQVYTEADEHVSISWASGGMDADRHVNVRIELALGTFQVTTVDAKRNVTYALPTLDAELEALIDIFEWQVLRAFRHPLRPASIALQNLVISFDSWHSDPYRSGDKNNRLAGRVITFRCRIPQDCPPLVTFDPVVEPPAGQLPHFDNAPYLDPLILALSKNPENSGLMKGLFEIATGNPQLRSGAMFRKTHVVYDAMDDGATSSSDNLNDGTLTVVQEWTQST